MISAKITIELFPAEGKQWALVSLEGEDEPTLVLAETIKALAMELTRSQLEGPAEAIPLNLGDLKQADSSQEFRPLSVRNMLGMAERALDERDEDEPELTHVEATPKVREEQYETAKNWKAAGGKASLQEFDLSGQNLRGVDLAGADLSRSNLEGANLENANLAGADLREALLSAANLSGASLKGANLSRATLIRYRSSP